MSAHRQKVVQKRQSQKDAHKGPTQGSAPRSRVGRICARVASGIMMLGAVVLTTLFLIAPANATSTEGDSFSLDSVVCDPAVHDYFDLTWSGSGTVEIDGFTHDVPGGIGLYKGEYTLKPSNGSPIPLSLTKAQWDKECGGAPTTEPTEPTEPSGSTEPTVPTGPDDCKEGEQWKDGQCVPCDDTTQPTVPTQPTEPTEPTEPSGSTEPTLPSGTTQTATVTASTTATATVTPPPDTVTQTATATATVTPPPVQGSDTTHTVVVQQQVDADTHADTHDDVVVAAQQGDNGGNTPSQHSQKGPKAHTSFDGTFPQGTDRSWMLVPVGALIAAASTLWFLTTRKGAALLVTARKRGVGL